MSHILTAAPCRAISITLAVTAWRKQIRQYTVATFTKIMNIFWVRHSVRLFLKHTLCALYYPFCEFFFFSFSVSRLKDFSWQVETELPKSTQLSVWSRGQDSAVSTLTESFKQRIASWPVLAQNRSLTFQLDLTRRRRHDDQQDVTADETLIYWVVPLRQWESNLIILSSWIFSGKTCII